jgi:V8-like Glu-specific endopeptidase
MELAGSPVRTGDPIRFAGYPGGKYTGWKLFEARGSITDVVPSLAYYDIETFKSNSGGPVWRETDGKSELVAIHVKPSGGRLVDDVYRKEVERLIGILDARAAQRGF